MSKARQKGKDIASKPIRKWRVTRSLQHWFYKSGSSTSKKGDIGEINAKCAKA